MTGAGGEFTVVVARRDALADGVVRLTLADPDGGQLPAWTPGAHLDLLLAPRLERQYSLCGDPADRSVLQVAVARERDGRGGSRYVHDELAEGATVGVRGPRNTFPLVAAERYLFVAGGIGITPLVPMVARAAAHGADWRLVYGGRTASAMAFAAPLAAAHPDRVELWPRDERGLLDLDGLFGAPRADTAVYCCGPEPLLAAVGERCARWPAGALHTERFSPATGGPAGPLEAFEVELAASGRTVTVPQDRSILQAVEDAGIQVLSSCREGTCGTCETDVLAGEVDHRDSLLTPEERAAGDVMFICVSRCRSGRLVLDL
ncbi:PDR/VanB family oxidoreductase [Streptomyces tremellae]|uniref:PDR/VanB family oxidoreductase n=1 Tax=Streptomyces tremellae TaxID=1124239 RepID=A0ABP7ENG1_9ACTN